MPLRNPVLRQLRRRRIPTWWQDAKLGDLRALDAGVGAGVRAGRHGDRRAPAIGPARRARVVAVQPSGTRTRCASPTAPPVATTVGVRRSPVRRVRGRLGGRARAVGSRRVGRALRRDRRALRRARHQASRRVLPLADRRAQPASVRVGSAAATSSASWPKPCAARACASASTTRGVSTGPSTTGRSARWPTCSPRSRAATTRPTPMPRSAS